MYFIGFQLTYVSHLSSQKIYIPFAENKSSQKSCYMNLMISQKFESSNSFACLYDCFLNRLL